MTLQVQIPAGQRRDTQALSQNKNYASIQAELESWFIINSARYSNKNRRLLKVWHIVQIGLRNNDYLEIGNYLFSLHAVSRNEAELLNSIFLRDRIADTEAYRLEEALHSLYRILRHNSPDYNIHSDPTSPWADANFSTA